jgi:hypothetical protein
LDYLLAFEEFRCDGCGRLPYGNVMPLPSAVKIELNPYNLERPRAWETTGFMGIRPGLLPDWVIGVEREK